MTVTRHSQKAKIIAAIPCFNTEVAIASVVTEARKYVDQVIVVDDGSHDGTAEVASAASAQLINHLKNRGYGEAIKSCFNAARYYRADILVTLDGDGQHKPEEIPALVAPIISGKADMTIGSRFLGNHDGIPEYRRFGIGVITFLWNFGSRTKVTDTQSGFRAYRRRLFDKFILSEQGMGISIEILEKARRGHAVIQEVPVSCTYDSSRLHVKAVRHGLSVAFSVIRIRFEHTIESLFSRAEKVVTWEKLPVRPSRYSRRIHHFNPR